MKTLESITKDEDIVFAEKKFKKKLRRVDLYSGQTFSLGVGIGLDYVSGLTLPEMVMNRFLGQIQTAITEIPYNWWREKCYHLTSTNLNNSKLRREGVELLAFNIFQIPSYAIMISTSTLVMDGRVSLEKVGLGSLLLLAMSPIFYFAKYQWNNLARRYCHLPTAIEGAYIAKINE